MMNYLLLGIAIVLLIVALFLLISYFREKSKSPFSRGKHR